MHLPDFPIGLHEMGPEVKIDLICTICLNLGRAKRENYAIALNLGPAANPCQTSTTVLQWAIIEMSLVVSPRLATINAGKKYEVVVGLQR